MVQIYKWCKLIRSVLVFQSVLCEQLTDKCATSNLCKLYPCLTLCNPWLNHSNESQLKYEQGSFTLHYLMSFTIVLLIFVDLCYKHLTVV